MENKNENRGGNSRKPRISSGLIFYGVLIISLIICSVILFGDKPAKGDETTLSDVIYYIESDDYDVSTVTIDGTNVTVDYLTSDGEERSISQTIPKDYVDDLVERLDVAKAEGKIDSYNYTEPLTGHL